MKKLLSLILSLSLLAVMGVAAAPSAAAYTLPDELTPQAAAAAVVFLGGNESEDIFLYEKNADAVHAPAALIRLMAGAYTLTQVKEKSLNMDTVTGTYTLEMFNTHVAGTGVTAVGMEFGETWKLRDLLTVSMIQTASDAATTLAYTVSGGVKEFVDGMNDLAKKIGCKNTHFANVTGLDSLSQYTTVRDIYRILRYALSFPEFKSLFCDKNNPLKQYAVQPVTGGQPYIIVNRVDMFRASTGYYYSPLVFGRTGLSEHEGWSLATIASDDGYDYMVILLGSPAKTADGKVGSHYTDTAALYRWAFRNFSYKTLLADSEILASVKVKHVWGKDTVNLVPKEAFSTVIYNTVEPKDVIKKVTINEQVVTAPIEKGTVLGKVELIVNVDEKIGEVELVAAETMKKSAVVAVFSGIGAVLGSGWLWGAIGLIVLLFGGYIGYAVWDAKRQRRKKMRRRRR